MLDGKIIQKSGSAEICIKMAIRARLNLRDKVIHVGSRKRVTVMAHQGCGSGPYLLDPEIFHWIRNNRILSWPRKYGLLKFSVKFYNFSGKKSNLKISEEI